LKGLHKCPTVNLGIHLMDLFLWLMGEWAEVRSAIGTLDRPIEVEDVSMALVRFENEALGSITNSVLSPRQESFMHLDFQRGTIEVSALYRYTNANWRFSAVESAAADLSSWQNIGSDISGTHDVQLLEILDSMDRHERPSVSGLEARRVLEFVASLYKAALLGRSVLRGSITRNDPFYHAMHGTGSEHDVPDAGFHIHS
jgi:predicted dehydrogenase